MRAEVLNVEGTKEHTVPQELLRDLKPTSWREHLGPMSRKPTVAQAGGRQPFLSSMPSRFSDRCVFLGGQQKGRKGPNEADSKMR